MVSGLAPQANVMTPPLATAATNALAVQLAGVPLPTTVVGCDTSSSAASAEIAQPPPGVTEPLGVMGRGEPASLVAVGPASAREGSSPAPGCGSSSLPSQPA